MTKLTFNDVKNNPQILRFLEETDMKLRAMGYTDHGLRHAEVVAKRCQSIAKEIGLSDDEVNYAAIAGYCHDIGNFLDRNFHHYWGALLFHQIFSYSQDIIGLSMIMQAIADHDKDETKLTNKISAALIIADKSDVHRDRVATKDLKEIKDNIHDRVNYSVYQDDLILDQEKKTISLFLKLDTEITPVMDYFEIFVQRMSYCRVGAEYLGYDFHLSINEFNLV